MNVQPLVKIRGNLTLAVNKIAGTIGKMAETSKTMPYILATFFTPPQKMKIILRIRLITNNSHVLFLFTFILGPFSC